jgi:hypothetical protein
MITRDGFFFYRQYLSIKLHFTGTYDTYQVRRDVYAFEKLSKLLRQEDSVDFYVSHFIEEKNPYIRNMSMQTYKDYKSKLKNMPSIFEEDLYRIKHISKTMLRCDGGVPEIYKWTLSKRINYETLIMLDSVFPFLDQHGKEVDWPFGMKDHYNFLVKYKPFLKKIESPIYNSITRKVYLSSD